MKRINETRQMRKEKTIDHTTRDKTTLYMERREEGRTDEIKRDKKR